MSNRLMFAFIMILLIVGIFTVFTTVVYAKGSGFLCSDKQDLLVTVKNDANMDLAKDKISKIPNVKIKKVQYRDKEWSKMVNKYDLPNMENPFKNEFTLKTNKKCDINEIYNRINEFDFVEKTEYISDTKCTGKQK